MSDEFEGLGSNQSVPVAAENTQPLSSAEVSAESAAQTLAVPVLPQAKPSEGLSADNRSENSGIAQGPFSQFVTPSEENMNRSYNTQPTAQNTGLFINYRKLLTILTIIVLFIICGGGVANGLYARDYAKYLNETWNKADDKLANIDLADNQQDVKVIANKYTSASEEALQALKSKTVAPSAGKLYDDSVATFNDISEMGNDLSQMYDLSTLYTNLEGKITSSQAALDSTSLSSTITSIENTRPVIETCIKELKKANVPSDFQDTHSKLIGAFEAMSSGYSSMAAGLRSKNQTQFQEGASKMDSSMTDLVSFTARIHVYFEDKITATAAMKDKFNNSKKAIQSYSDKNKNTIFSLVFW